MARLTYQTRQKKMLVEFLNAHHNKQYTIDEIVAQMTAEHLRGGESDEDEKLPGKSTVYRIMNQLVDEGLVRRFSEGGGSRQFLYQAMESSGCRYHFHLKCVRCGKLIHLDDELSLAFEQAVRDKFAFFVDEGQTMIFGSCEECGNRVR